MLKDPLTNGQLWRLLEGHVLDTLREIPERSVQCVVTSPPYFGLRAYSAPAIWGGDPACFHAYAEELGGAVITGGLTPKQVTNAGSFTAWQAERWYVPQGGGVSAADAFASAGPANAARLKAARWHAAERCLLCGAWRGELGAERTPEEFIQHLVLVCREVWRVLCDDGVLFVNIGDSYAGSGRGPTGHNGIGQQGQRQGFEDPGAHVPPGYKAKDLIGTPWMLAFALRADGWYLRQDIIWAKPNTMPESVRDRCTRSHEYLFLLTKRKRYYWDAAAIAEPVTSGTVKRLRQNVAAQAGSARANGGAKMNGPMRAVGTLGTRNKRSVWTVNPRGFPGAHFATFPPELVEPCILAGSRPGDVVLDPFAGSGTTLIVALRHGRRVLGCELQPDYVKLATERIVGDSPLFNYVPSAPAEVQESQVG